MTVDAKAIERVMLLGIDSYASALEQGEDFAPELRADLQTAVEGTATLLADAHAFIETVRRELDSWKSGHNSEHPTKVLRRIEAAYKRFDEPDVGASPPASIASA